MTRRVVTIQQTARAIHKVKCSAYHHELRSVHCYSAALFSRGVCRLRSLRSTSGCTTPCVRTAAYSCIASSLRRMLMRRCISLSAHLESGRWLNCNRRTRMHMHSQKKVLTRFTDRVYIPTKVIGIKSEAERRKPDEELCYRHVLLHLYEGSVPGCLFICC